MKILPHEPAIARYRLGERRKTLVVAILFMIPFILWIVNGIMAIVSKK